MTSNWLYPLSRTADRTFVDTEGEPLPDTCFGCFVHMHHRKTTDDRWYLRRHVADITPGDNVWPYYGTADGDRGIVGPATVLDVDTSEPAVDLHWNRAVTSRLLIDPFRAGDVRRYIQYPRAAVVSMDDHQQLLGALLHHVAQLKKP